MHLAIIKDFEHQDPEKDYLAAIKESERIILEAVQNTWKEVTEQDKLDAKEAGDYWTGVNDAPPDVPKTFTGIVLIDLRSRSIYHRLLYNYMKFSARKGNFKLAIKLAKKQLKIDPHDHFGLRYDLPCLYAANNDLFNGFKALKALKQKSLDARTFLVTALLYHNAREYREYGIPFVRAMLMMPVIRKLFSVDGFPKGDDIEPSLDSIKFHLELLPETTKELSYEWRNFLEDRTFKKCEQSLTNLYKEDYWRWNKAILTYSEDYSIMS
ncbi:MAG: hypothetical protein WCP46_09065 [Alphaproteobacteria bacterium]